MPVSQSVSRVSFDSIVAACPDRNFTKKNISMSILLLALLLATTRGDRQSYFEDLIDSRINGALDYRFQEDAKMHQPQDASIVDFGVYDFIVVGAGATGCVIASRLSEIQDWEILLLEAGDDPDDFVMIPSYFAVNIMTDYNWGYQTVPQENACLGNVDRSCRLPTGKGSGGGTLLSELVYSRGDPQIYDKWATMVQDPSWAFENVLPYFKKSENYTGSKDDAFIEEDYHGFGGYLEVTNFEKLYPLSEIFLAGNDDLGIKYTDYNGREQIGSTILQINTKNGKRYDQYSAFIKPIKNERENLRISKGSYVIKIEFNSTKHATGVLFTKNNKTYRARVNNEVILSAGVIASPQLLMLSGIGPQDHLKEHGIEVLENLEVGSTFRDHLMTQVFFSSNLSALSNASQSEQIKEYLTRHTGILTAPNPIDVIGVYAGPAHTQDSPAHTQDSPAHTQDSPSHTQHSPAHTQHSSTHTQHSPTHTQHSPAHTRHSPAYPAVQLSVSQGGASPMTKKLLNWDDQMFQELYGRKVENAFTLVSLLLHSRSTGTVRLKSSSPYDYPLIDGKYLSDPEGLDIETLYEGIQIALSLIETPAFQWINASLAVPQIPPCEHLQYLSKDFWYCFIRQTAKSAFHPMGTCPMGVHNKAVVNSHFKVFGVKGLRVADASVFPFALSGQPTAVCTMMGEKLADIIKKKYGNT